MNNKLKGIAFLFIFADLFNSSAFSQEHGWEWLNPLPQGDRILQIHFANKSVGWLVPQSANIFKTTDGGVTWERIQTPVIFKKISFLNEDLAWGIGNTYVNNLNFGVYRTIDGGITWKELTTDTTTLDHDIVFVDEQHGWAIGRGVLWHTGDGGETWVEQARGQIHYGGGDYKLSFLDAKKGWAGGWFGWVIKTDDGGENWIRDSTLAGYSQFSFVDTLFGWAGSTKESYTRQPISRTTDGGVTWIPTPEKLVGQVFPFSRDTCLALAEDGIYKTTDAGTTWTMISEHLFNSAFFHGQNNGWGWEQNHPRIHQTLDGGSTWENQTFTALESSGNVLRAIDFVDETTGWILVRDSGTNGKMSIAKTTDGGKSWLLQEIDFPDDAFNLHFISKDVGWIVGQNGLIQKTVDGGETWQSQSNGKSNDLLDILFISSLNGWIVGSDGVILKTDDGGQTWRGISSPINILLKDVCFVDSSFGWVSGNWIFPNIGQSLLRTTDGGETWHNPIVDKTTDIELISFIDPARGWARAQNRDLGISVIVTTSDSGKTWQEQFNTPHMGSGTLKFTNANSGWMIGGFGRIYHTTDGGRTWFDQTGVTSRLLSDLDYIDDNQTWIVGDYGTILHTKTGGLPTHVNEKMEDVQKTVMNRLYQSYPNPVNGIATIRFELSEGGKVVFELFDLLGRKQRVFDLGWKDRGQHEFTVDVKNFPSAIYLYRMKTDIRILSGKMSIVK